MEEKVFCTQWLADGVGDDYKKWLNKAHTDNPFRSAARIYIESPTGTGKTSFVINKLLPYAAEKNRHILYIGNRSALKEQTQNALRKKLVNIADPNGFLLTSEDDELAEIGLNNIQVFQYPGSQTTITIMNYQAVLGAQNLLRSMGPFYYVILDEAHFFFEDALFNAKTYLIFERIMQLYYNAVLVFMSATLEEVKPMFRSAMEFFRGEHPYAELRDLLYSETEFSYQNTISPSNYKPIFFFEESTLLRQIESTSPKEKWLIFVSSKQIGRSLKKVIQEQTKRTVRFLDASKKATAGWKLLVDEARFEENILIVTSVLDNGANIKDSAVKHVVLPATNRVEYLQMLGRRRITGNECLTIYTKVPTIQSLNSQLRQIAKMYRSIMAVSRATGEHAKTHILQEYWTKNDPAVNGLFYIDHHRYLIPNPFAIAKMEYLIALYEKLIAHSENPLCYQEEVLSWLRLPSENPQHLWMTNADTLIDLLRHFEGQIIPENHLEDFYKEFQLLYKVHCLELFGKNKERLSYALGVRKGTKQRKATINKELTIIGYPYQIVKRQHGWMIQRTK